jgi:photosystem II stability/assembly factor-like uncharacterized protein
MASPGTLLLGTRKGLLTLKRTNSDWRVARHNFAGAAVPYACADFRSGTLWACISYGHWGHHLHRSRDGGETWEEVAVPAFPEGAMLKENEPAKMDGFWHFKPAGPNSPNRLYVGTSPGALFRSDDEGDSFTHIEGLFNHPSRLGHWFAGGEGEEGAFVHSIVEDPRDPNHLFVGISVAGVFETTDGGATWTPRNKGLEANFLPDPHAEVGHDPHCLVGCESNPDILWQQNHCGIFRSTDGGKAWQLVSESGGPAHFGFPIHVDPHDADTAWVVPAVSDENRIAVGGALCVSRTEDGGKTWTALREGLPQTDCYDIVFRHALDGQGDDLAFGSTTGNAYASPDRGDSWVCLGTNLPPVYSVRFSD